MHLNEVEPNTPIRAKYDVPSSFFRNEKFHFYEGKTFQVLFQCAVFISVSFSFFERNSRQKSEKKHFLLIDDANHPIDRIHLNSSSDTRVWTISLYIYIRKTTDAAAAHEDDEKGLDDAGRADDPSQTDEEDDAENVLHAREVDAGAGAQFRRRFLGRFAVGAVGRRRRVRIYRRFQRVAVVGQRVDQRRHPRPVAHLLLSLI